MTRGLLLFRLSVSAVLVAACLLEVYLLSTLELSPAARASAAPWAVSAFIGYHLIGAMNTLLGAALGFALLWRSGEHGYARALALFVALVTFASGDGMSRLRQRLELPQWADAALDATMPVALFLSVVALIWFAGLFPRPLPPAALADARVLRRTRLWFLRGGLRWGTALLVFAPAEAVVLTKIYAPPLQQTAEALFGWIRPFLIFLVLVGFAVAALNLRAGYRAADEAGKRRVFWILEGLLAGTTLLVFASALKLVQMATGFNSPVRDWYGIVLMAGVGVMLSCVSIAVFFAGAIDPRLAVRRTAVVGAVGVLMVFVFAGAEQLIQDRLAGWLGLSDHLGGVLTGGTVALTFDPIRRWVERIAGRVLGPPEATPAPLAEPMSAPAVGA